MENVREIMMGRGEVVSFHMGGDSDFDIWTDRHCRSQSHPLVRPLRLWLQALSDAADWAFPLGAPAHHLVCNRTILLLRRIIAWSCITQLMSIYSTYTG